MKFIAVSIFSLALAACSQSSSVSATPESVATAYMDSLFSQDVEAMKRIVRPNSIAEYEWYDRSKIIKLMQATPDIKRLGYQKVKCSENTYETRCFFNITSSKGPILALGVRVLEDGLKIDHTYSIKAQ